MAPENSGVNMVSIVSEADMARGNAVVSERSTTIYLANGSAAAAAVSDHQISEALLIPAAGDFPNLDMR